MTGTITLGKEAEKIVCFMDRLYVIIFLWEGPDPADTCTECW